MGFVRLDGVLSGFYSVVFRLHELPSTVLCFQGGFYWFCCLIVCDVECRLVTLGYEVVEDFLECFDDGVVFEVFDWQRVYIICVVVLCNEEVLHTVQQHVWECTYLVGVHCTCLFIS